VGTAQALDVGGFHFDAGFVPDPAAPSTRFTQLYTLDPSGFIAAALRVYAQEYRNIRMIDLYTPQGQWVRE